ncbi:MAG: hypothetical protein KJ720_10360 [Proteobacteria bacterium]|nr:hypothetical protein [Pseudomonadota bacterium]MBU1452002.1 hypothetical protein [Pseudomonadota bacterium]MBU2467490.1 hypothetical protein [Pseudomonadota bacterium]MBU2517717.1 hypothetical protein [Pseudomonadota bacterium]
MKRLLPVISMLILLAVPAWAGQCVVPPGGQCSLAMEPAPAPVEVVNLNQQQGATVLGFWLYSGPASPRQIAAGLNPGEALIFSPPRAKDGQGNLFAPRTLVIYNMGTIPLSARTVR